MAKRAAAAKSVESIQKYRTSADTRNARTNIGYPGLRMSGGRVGEEFLADLRGPKGMKIIREMESNDPIVGAVLFAISMLIRQCDWEVKPFDSTNEHMQRADAIQTMMDDMATTWSDVLSEILSMLPYGWAFLETTYKNRNGYTNGDDPLSSKYSDGFIGWQNMEIRGQDTLQEWVTNASGRIIGWRQQDYEGRTATLPLSKGLLFRTQVHKDNPEGRSILRNAYRPWYFKKRIEEIEAIGIERDLNGVPVMTPAEGIDIWNQNDPEAVQYLDLAQTVVRNLRRDEQEGIVKPFGWTLELLSTSGTRAVDTTAVLGRYANSIAMTCLADFIVLGHNNRYGSKALAGNKTAMFQSSITGWGMAIADVLNRIALTKLYALNAWPMDAMAHIQPKGLMLPDLEAMSIYVKNLSAAGFKMFPNEPIEKALLQLADLPSEGVELGREAPEPKPFGGGDDGGPSGSRDADDPPSSDPASDE
jgi:hypothetical protein